MTRGTRDASVMQKLADGVAERRRHVSPTELQSVLYVAVTAGARAWTVGRTVDIAAGSARGRAEK
jgi:hypothetical protein